MTRVTWVLMPALLMACSSADAVNVAPHRALYELSLDSAKPNSGVVSAIGVLGFEWGEACDGWTNEQRFKLSIRYEQEQPLETTSSLVTWESKDGLAYRFTERRSRNGQAEDEVKGKASRASLTGPGKVIMEKPKAQTMDLAAGGLFPTGHTLMLIQKGLAGQNFVSAEVFDGSDSDGASLISAVIAPAMAAKDTAATVAVDSPLLERPSWKVRLGFFPDSSKDDTPDYNLEMRLLDNGVSSEMLIDYGDYVIKATLKKIQAIKKPTC